MPLPALPADLYERRRAKAVLLRDAANHPSFSRPWVRDGLRVQPTLVVVEDRVIDGQVKPLLVVHLRAWHVGGAEIDLTTPRMTPRGAIVPLPFEYQSPPPLVDDPAGDITEVDVLPDGSTVPRRLRYDPAEAFRQIVTDTVKAYL